MIYLLIAWWLSIAHCKHCQMIVILNHPKKGWPTNTQRTCHGYQGILSPKVEISRLEIMTKTHKFQWSIIIFPIEMQCVGKVYASFSDTQMIWPRMLTTPRIMRITNRDKHPTHNTHGDTLGVRHAEGWDASWARDFLKCQLWIWLSRFGVVVWLVVEPLPWKIWKVIEEYHPKQLFEITNQHFGFWHDLPHWPIDVGNKSNFWPPNMEVS